MESRTKAVIKNSFWLISESLLTMLISLIVGVISARYLGPNNYGLINRFLPYISLANSICTFGLQSIIIKRIAQDPSDENVAYIMGSTLIFRMVLSTCAVIIINTYAFIISKEDSSILLIVSLLQSCSLFFNAYEIITYFFHARLQSKFIAISTVITSVIVGMWKILLLVNAASVEWFAFSTTLQSIVQWCTNYFFFKRVFRVKLFYNGSILKNMIGEGYHLLLASMGIAIYGQVDKIMIGSMLGNSQLGLYSAAYAIATMWYFLPQAIANSLRSRIFEEVKSDRQFTRDTRVLYFIITMFGVFAGIGFTILPRLLISILYGNDYLEATNALIILGWVGLFANIGTARSIWLVAKNLHPYSKYFTLMGAALNVVMNGVLIPLYGICGAAIATVISQMCVQFVFPLFFRDTRCFVLDFFKSMLLIKDWRLIVNTIRKK